MQSRKPCCCPNLGAATLQAWPTTTSGTLPVAAVPRRRAAPATVWRCDPAGRGLERLETPWMPKTSADSRESVVLHPTFLTSGCAVEPAHRAWKERACPGPGPPLPTCPTCHQLSEFFTGSLVIHPATTQSPCRYRASTVNRDKHLNPSGPRCSAVLRETRGDHDPKSGSAAIAPRSRTLAGPHACYHWRHGRSLSILVFTSCKLCRWNSIRYLSSY
jgi:hypothetical protein